MKVAKKTLKRYRIICLNRKEVLYHHMDFLEIIEKRTTNNSKTRQAGTIDIYPDFKVCKSKDLMVRGHSFYAIWDQKQSVWITDEMEVARLVDQELYNYREQKLGGEENVNVRTLGS